MCRSRVTRRWESVVCNLTEKVTGFLKPLPASGLSDCTRALRTVSQDGCAIDQRWKERRGRAFSVTMEGGGVENCINVPVLASSISSC